MSSVCKTCVDDLWQRTNGKKKYLKFVMPMVWREQKNLIEGCYLCLVDGNYTRMLRVILNKSCRQHPTRHQLYGHLPPKSNEPDMQDTAGEAGTSS